MRRRIIFSGLLCFTAFATQPWAAPKIQILVRLSRLAPLVSDQETSAPLSTQEQDRQLMLWVAEAEEGYVSLGDVPAGLAEFLKKENLGSGIDLEGAQRRVAVSAKREGRGFTLRVIPEIVFKKDGRVIRLDSYAGKFEVPSGEPAEAGPPPGKKGIAKEFYSDGTTGEWKIVLTPLAL